MRKVLILLVLATLATSAMSQSDTTQKFKLNLHGFVNPHYYADSRSVVGGREDMMLFYPKPILRDSLGRDINDGWQANMLSITARLGLTINGPDMLGAKTSGYIEGDFTGSTNATNNNLRLRHAYFTLDWGKHKLLAGQYWYAMVIHEIMPMTNPLNMGAPFHPYARYNQVRYSWKPGVFEAVAVAQWQLDNMSHGMLDGVYTSSTTFARRSLLPELNLQARINNDRLLLGAAANMLTIQPQVPQTTLDSRLHSSYTFSLFGKYRFDGFTIKAQTLLNNSLYEGCSLGGYLLLTYAGSGREEVQDWHFNTVWMDIERTRGHWRPGLFMGYAKQQSTTITTEKTVTHAFGRGWDIDYLWRVQPRLTYTTLKGLSFVGEAELTTAKYIVDAEPVCNLRLSLSAVYAF
jgi:hypothetical protein